MDRSTARWLSPLFAALCGACVLAPDGLQDEHERLEQAGARYALQPEEREVPELSAQPTYDELLRRTFLLNGALEASWHEWRAAVHEVTAAAAWPSSNLEVEFETLFAGDAARTWDTTMWRVGFDAAEGLMLPNKTALRGEVALREAQAAAERFRGAKFALQRRFTEAWIEWVSARHEIETAQRSLELMRISAESAGRAASASKNPLNLVRARLEIAASEDELLRLESRARRAWAVVSALAQTGGDHEPAVEPLWPDLRAPELGDEDWIALAARSNPMLVELARDVAGRSNALDLAQAAWWPDVMPFVGFTGGTAEFFGAAFTIPTQVQRIRAEVEMAKARLDESRARVRQGGLDARAGVVADLLALRESERALRFATDTLQPLAVELASAARSAYAGGSVMQMEWLDALRAENEVRTGLIAARAEQALALARLQEWIGVDLATVDANGEVRDE
jgi:cobalt-zinc-cadmium efflux system outer membrane protein